MKTALILANLWRPDEPPIRTWEAEIVDNKVTMNYKDFVDAIEIMKGSYIHRLRLKTVLGKDLRTIEQLEENK